MVAAVTACSFPNPDYQGTTSGPGSTTVMSSSTSSTTVVSAGSSNSSSGGDLTSVSSDTETTGDTDSPVTSPCAGSDWSVVTWERIVSVSTETDEYDPFLLADGRTLLYTSYGDWGHLDILTATRAAPSDSFIANPHDGFFGLNTSDDEAHIHLSLDGFRAYFASRRGPDVTAIYFAERDDISADFVEAAPILMGPNSHNDPHLSDDELDLYYATQDDIWLTTRASARNPFPPGAPLDGINDPDASDSNPSLSRDGLILVFASSRAGIRDVFVSRRAASSDPFGTPAPAPDPINDPVAVDGDPFIADRHGVCELFWFSDRRGGAGGVDLYRAELAPIP